jgi:hypothetical protein
MLQQCWINNPEDPNLTLMSGELGLFPIAIVATTADYNNATEITFTVSGRCSPIEANAIQAAVIKIQGKYSHSTESERQCCQLANLLTRSIC